MRYFDDIPKKERFIVTLFFLIIVVAMHFLIDSSGWIDTISGRSLGKTL